jgi:hypothetical protein
MWKVTFTAFNVAVLPLYGCGLKPTVWTKVYRRKWRAKLAAFNPCLGGVIIDAKIEPYWPGATNVVPLRAA